LKIDVKDSEAHLLMAGAYEKKGDIVEAGKACKRAVEADPSNEAAWRALIDNYRTQGRLSELLQYAVKKREANQDSEVLKK